MHRGAHRRRKGRQGRDHLRAGRSGLPRHGTDGGDGHFAGGCGARAGPPPCDRQKGEAGEDDLIVEI